MPRIKPEKKIPDASVTIEDWTGTFRPARPGVKRFSLTVRIGKDFFVRSVQAKNRLQSFEAIKTIADRVAKIIGVDVQIPDSVKREEQQNAQKE